MNVFHSKFLYVATIPKISTHCVHVASLGRFTLASAEALRFWLARLRMFTDRAN